MKNPKMHWLVRMTLAATSHDDDAVHGPQPVSGMAKVKQETRTPHRSKNHKED
ncbi:hypothetical protein [Paraburkholderia bannensis]|uniref:hypothetical protein n=1 Tax=Paraburkholderia bannensis TaxID=765414 RepID=UPI002AB788B2|nr:hypothetical protein [Paraburkholderia bannensis]